MTGISAVVATYRRSTELKRLLDSLLKQHLVVFELIVVDQNTDGLIDNLIAEYSSLLSIRHLKMKDANQSKARNYGAKHATYPVVCFPDDDCWFESDALTKVHTHFQNNSSTDLLIINWKQNPHTHSNSTHLTHKEIFSFRSVGYVTYVLFFKKEMFERLGGFIENIGIGQYIGGGEDSELTFRAAQQKLSIYYDASILVYHHYIPINSRDLPVIRARQRGMGMVYAKFDIPRFVIVRGMTAPLWRMVTAGSVKKSKEYYNIFRGRIEGFVHTLKSKNSSRNTPAGVC
jgi:glycosyltransferase involved in cell wall biosynthesis